MKKIELPPHIAEQIIIETQSNGAYDGEVPASDAAKVKLAVDITQQALEAYINLNMRGSEITTILALAQIEVEDGTAIWGQDTDSFPDSDDYTVSQGSEEGESDHTLNEEADEKPEAPQTLEFPIENYDNLRLPAILHKFDDELTADEIDYVLAYERRNKARKGVLKYDAHLQFKEETEDDLDAEIEAELDALENEQGETVEQEIQDQTPSLVDEVFPPDEAYAPEASQPAVKPTAQHESILNNEQLSKVDRAHVEAELAHAKEVKEGLPVPSAIEADEAPDMPRDITDLPDEQLMKLRSEFGACLAYANWLLALSTIDENAYDHLVDYASNKAQKSISYTNDEGKKKAEALIDRERKDSIYDDSVEVWRTAQRASQAEVTKLKALVKIYESYLDILSRQWSYREAGLKYGG